MSTQRYVSCLGFECSNKIPDMVPGGTCDKCIALEAALFDDQVEWQKAGSLPAIAQDWHAMPRDKLLLIIEAGYHCGHTDAEVRQMMKDQGLEEISDESLAHLRGSYAEFEAETFGSSNELDSALFCAEQMALDIKAAEQVFETFQIVRGAPFEPFNLQCGVPVTPDGKCSACGVETVFAPVQPDLCYGCAVKDADEGCAQAMEMADNMRKYGTIDRPKFDQAVEVTHLDASFIGTGERTAFHSEPVKVKIAPEAKDPLTGCDHKGQLTYHDSIFDRCKACGSLVDGVPF